MKDKKLRYTFIVCSLCLAVILIIALAANVSINTANPFAAVGGIVSVSFDKQQMKQVNRIVVSDGEKEIEIVDPAMIASVVQETMVARHIGTGCNYERKILLLCDDTLVRTMYWSPCCDSVYVYDGDAAHWIVSTESITKGYVYLSDSLATELNKLLPRKCISGAFNSNKHPKNFSLKRQ